MKDVSRVILVTYLDQEITVRLDQLDLIVTVTVEELYPIHNVILTTFNVNVNPMSEVRDVTPVRMAIST